MKNYLHSSLLAALLLLLLCTFGCRALDCQPNNHTITVDKSGHDDFTSVQTAIDSIPENNNQWIHILISPGIYREKVSISVKRPCIFLEGAGMKLTILEWHDHVMTGSSPTFTSFPENILVKGITFKNTYNLGEKAPFKQAVSARVKGDKTAFHQCAFVGVQDTLWDERGRHYFKGCYIEGAIDFIFGKGQSIYEGCAISVNIERYTPGLHGSITAQKKEWIQQPSGFVFKKCVIGGTGKAFLGRAWGPYSTVIFHKTFMQDMILPQGWDAWDYVGHEGNFTYVEDNNRGPGANTIKRVPWVKKLSANELKKFLRMSYIDQDGWLEKMPNSF